MLTDTDGGRRCVRPSNFKRALGKHQSAAVVKEKKKLKPPPEENSVYIIHPGHFIEAQRRVI